MPSRPALAALVLASLAGLALGALWVLWPGRAPEPPVAAAIGATTEDWQAGGTLVADAPAAAAPQPVPVAATPQPADRTTLVQRVAEAPRLGGRLVDERRQPLAGTVLLRSQRAAVLPVDTFATDAQGRFEFTVPARAALTILLRASGRTTMATETAGLELGAAVDFGDIVLAPGAVVTGSLRGEDGLPVADTLVELRHDPTRPFRRDVHPLRTVAVRSTSGGGLQFEDPLHAGDWRVYVHDRGRIKPARLQIAEGQRSATLDLIAAPGSNGDAAITGRITDQFGQPVAGARVSGGHDGERWPFAALSDRDGRYRLLAKKPDPDKPIRLLATAAHCKDAESRRTYAWGATDADLVVERGAALTVRVVDHAGAPLEDFTLRVFHPDCADLEELRSRSHGWHPGGVARAYGIPAGEHYVMVEPQRGGLAQDGLLRIQSTGGADECLVALGQASTRSLLVRGAGGRPVAEATVELILPVRGRFTVDTPARGVLELWKAPGPAGLRLGHAMTDAAGGATLRGHAHTTYLLRVKRHDHAPLLMPIQLGWSSAPIEVQLPVGARLEGTLLPALAAAQTAELGKFVRFEFRLLPEDDALAVRPGKLGKDGKFAFTAVPAGDWRLEASWNPPGGRPTQRVLLARVHGLADGETRALAVDGSDLLHSEIRCRTFVGGQSKFYGSVEFQNVDVREGEAPWSIQASMADGMWRAVLPRGRWRPLVLFQSNVKHRVTNALIAGPVLDLDPPRSFELTLQTEAVRVRALLRDASGAPVVKRKVTVRHEGVPLPGDFGTDAEGYLTTLLAPGMYTTEFGPVEVR